jgi:hypothetical protein
MNAYRGAGSYCFDIPEHSTDRDLHSDDGGAVGPNNVGVSESIGPPTATIAHKRRRNSYDNNEQFIWPNNQKEH